MDQKSQENQTGATVQLDLQKCIELILETNPEELPENGGILDSASQIDDTGSGTVNNGGNKEVFRGCDKLGNSLMGDFSILPRILASIKIGIWRQTRIGNHTFSRSRIVDEVTIESTLLQGLNVIHRNINAFSLVALANEGRTQI